MIERYTEPDKCAHGLPYRLVVRKEVLAAFSTTTDSVLSDGTMMLFWLDRWIEDGFSVSKVAPSILHAIPQNYLRRMVADVISRNS